MLRQRIAVLEALLLVGALGLASTHRASAQAPSVSSDLGLIGYVLAPDGAPVSDGTVVLRWSPGNRITTSIDGSGRFLLVPQAAGDHELHVIVPGLAPRRVNVIVPLSRTVKLPVIRLSPATYFRVRPVSAGDAPIGSPRLRRRSVDMTGTPITEPPDQGVEIATDSEGFLTIGPLSRGITTLALESPPLAPARLNDLYVTGEDPLLDGGTVTLDAGAVLHVDVVDASGAPLPGQNVFLDEMRPLSPLSFKTTRTNANGRATFEPLATGQYRVRTFASRLCNGRTITIARVVPISGAGTFVARIVASGTAAFRFTTPFGPMVGVQVVVSPDSFESPPLPGLRTTTMQQRLLSGGLAGETSCGGSTDTNGRLILENFPPGPARVSVSLPNSRYIRRVTVPEGAREMTLPIPDGLLPVLVTNALQKRPVGAAEVTWIGGGARVEARAVASGDALLEGVAATPGTLAVTATGYERVETKLGEAPATTYEVALMPTPGATLRAAVTTASGEPVPHAIVVLTPEDALETGRIAAADAKGVVTFSDVPAGTLQLTASADGFATGTAQVSDDDRSGAVLMLSRGYRAILSLELPPEDGQQLIRVVNETGSSVDDLLDLSSDRRVAPAGRVSLGPLPPGTYVIDFSGVRERRQVRLSIVDGDVSVTLR